MSKVLPPQDFLHCLACPHCLHLNLEVQDNEVHCRSCGRTYRINADGILEFVVAGELDAPTAQELVGHTFDFTPQQTAAFLLREKASLWRNYYSRNRRRAIRHLAEFLDGVDCRRLFFLGVGTGREIEYLLSFRKLHSVLCSDLSLTALRMLPMRLEGRGLEIGLFTSDLQQCPVVCRDTPVVVVNALHHTRDMHETLEGLLNKGYGDLFLIEPTDNALIRFLARLGWARRREYSGVIPGRLDPPRLRAMCRQHGYRMTLKTHWEFPRDYYQRLFGTSPSLQKVFFMALDAFSSLSNMIKFGNFSVVHLARELPQQGKA